ncbi:hypothetical protein HGM15179_007850 [Zosterops borbonicus]|uniref:Uncharacterized protein n=1 Tax=Zosterops borbonicus TaxID=364589 RepID=A0A8K1LMC2_9PASS|nr:hypothetical protein HGM15179_007850 [Zosterops borbonicus]
MLSALLCYKAKLMLGKGVVNEDFVLFIQLGSRERGKEEMLGQLSLGYWLDKPLVSSSICYTIEAYIGNALEKGISISDMWSLSYSSTGHVFEPFVRKCGECKLALLGGKLCDMRLYPYSIFYMFSYIAIKSQLHELHQMCFVMESQSSFIPQSVQMLVIALTQVQDLALGLVEFHKVCTVPPVKPVKVPLDDIPSLQCVNGITQPGVTHKLAEGVLNLTAYAINKDLGQGRPR